jgi:multimeric flavodoxin WrbA
LKPRVLGISGSPRISSNTSILIETALEAARKQGALTEFIPLSDLRILDCKHCSECSKLGSPDHHATITTPLKNLMDRTGRFLHLEGKVACGFVVARRSGADIALSSILFFMLVKEMIIPGGVHWPIGFALNAGDIRGDTEAMAMAEQMGARIAQLASIIVKNPLPWATETRPLGQKVRFGDEWK